MTTSELIAILQARPPYERVIVNGYEGGFHDVKKPTSQDIKLNVNTEWCCGPHDVPNEYNNETADETAFLIV